MSGRRIRPRPQTPEELMRWFDQRIDEVANKREYRLAGGWVFSVVDGKPSLTRPAQQTLEVGQVPEPDFVDLTGDRGYVTAHEVTEALTGTPGPLGGVVDFLTAKWNDLTTATNNIGAMITNALVGTATELGTALAGAVANANTAVTNAGNALTQISQMITGAAVGGATALGNALAGAVTNIQNTFNGFWEAIFGGTASGKTSADLKTAAQQVNATANTGVTNAATADAKAVKAQAMLNTRMASAANIATNPGMESANFYMANAFRTSAQAHSGNYSAMLTSTGTSYPVWYVMANDTSYMGIPCVASDAFYVEYWVYGDAANTANAGSLFVQFNCLTTTGAVAGYAQTAAIAVTTALNGVWTKVAGIVLMPANTASASVGLYVNLTVPAGNKFYFDDVVVKEYTYAQQLIDQQNQAIVGGTTTGYLLSTLKTNLTTLNSNASTALTNAASSLSQLSSMITNAATGTAAALGTALSGAVTNIQNTFDRFWEGIFGGSASGKTSTDLKTAAQQVNSTANTGVTNAATADAKAVKAQSMLTAAIAAGPNIVPDPGFDNTNFAAVWNGAYSTEQARGGSRSIKMIGNGSANQIHYWTRSDTGAAPLTASPNDVFYVEGWVYGKSTNVGGGVAYIGMTAKNAAGTDLGYPTISVSATTALNGVWTKLSGYLTMPAGTTQAYGWLQLHATTPNGDAYYFDDLVVKEYTYAQQLIDSQNQAIVGGSGTGNLLATLKTNFQTMVSNANTAGTNASSALTQLSGMITNAVAGTAANLGTMLATAGTNIQNTFDRFWEGIFGGTVSGKTSADLKTAAQQVNSTANTGVTNAATADAKAVLAKNMLSNAITKGANIATNPGFENTSVFGTYTLGGTITTAQSHGGTQSIMFTANGSSQWVYLIAAPDGTTSQLAPCAPGDVFYIEFWVYGKSTNVQTSGGGGGLRVVVSWRDKSNVGLTPVTITAAASTALNGVWTKVSGYVTAPANTSFALIYLEVLGVVTTGEVYYFDDVVIKEYTYAQQIIDQQNQAIVGGSGTGNLLSVLKTSLQGLTSTANTAGTNATSAVNQISSMLTNAVAGTAATFGTMLANAGTNIQNTWDRFWEGIYGGTVSGKTATDVKTAAQQVNSTASTANTNANTANSSITTMLTNAAAANAAAFGTALSNAGSQASSAVGQLSSMITNAATGTAAALGTALSGAVNNIQNTFDRFWEGIFGGSASGKTAADLKTAAQQVNATANTGVTNANTADAKVVATNTALFGASTPGTAIQKTAVPDITRDMSSSNQSIIDAILAISGSSGTGSDEAAIRAAVQAIPQKYVIPLASPAVSVTPDTGQTSTGWTPYLATSAATGAQVATGSHTFGANANFVVVPVRYYGSGTSSAYTRSVTIGATTMVSLGVYAPVSSGPVLEFFGAYIPVVPAGAQTITVTVTPNAPTSYLYFILAGSASYCNVSAVSAISTYSYSGGTPASLSQAITSATNNYVVQAFAAYRNNGVPGLTGYNKTVRYDSGDVSAFLSSGNTAQAHMVFGDAPGASTVTFTATSSNSTTNHGVGINLLATGGGIMGSGFRAWRNSTTAVTALAADTPTLLAGTFFDRDVNSAGPPSGVYKTADLTWDTATNKLTVSYAGWYSGVITLAVSASLATSSFFAAMLYINGTLARRGPTVYVPSGSSVPGVISMAFKVYLNSGDYLQPGGYRSTTTSGVGAFIGNSDGTLSSFEVALDNRSVY